jgi:hypothetical protein
MLQLSGENVTAQWRRCCSSVEKMLQLRGEDVAAQWRKCYSSVEKIR